MNDLEFSRELPKPQPLELRLKEEQEQKKVLREAVQGKDSRKVPAGCKTPDRCPLIANVEACTNGALPSYCFDVCGIHSI